MKRQFIFSTCAPFLTSVAGSLLAPGIALPVLAQNPDSPAAAGAAVRHAPVVDSEFGNTNLPRNNVASERVTGTIIAPWQDDSSWANVTLKYQPMTEGGRSFQRVDITAFNSGFVQIQHPVPEMGGSRIYRLEATLRGTERLPLSLGVRHRGAPYNFLWRRDVVLTPQWQELTRYFEMPQSTQPISFFIQSGAKGVLDIQRLHVREVSREEVEALSRAEVQRASLDGQVPPNFLRETRFPLGLPDGWAFTDNQRGNPPGFQVKSDAGVLGPSGAPALQLKATAAFRLSSPSFALPLVVTPHVASVWVRAEKPVTLAVVARNADLVKKEFAPAGKLQWQRLELPFTPQVNADAYSLRVEGNDGDWALDGFQVNAGEKAPAYAGQWPAEVALVDEVGQGLRWAVTGAPAGAVLKIRQENAVSGAVDAAVPLGAGFLQEGNRPYAAAALANSAPIRSVAWVENGAGKRLSDRASLTADRSFFPFVIPWDDAAPTILDVSHLNKGPAGSGGFIQTRNGQLVEGNTGKRVRFIGVVFTAFQAFPNRADAEKVAARLAKYGVNLVRLHYIDNMPIKNGNLWDDSDPQRRRLDPTKLDKLDYFVAQLKKHGVYVNINLKVGREYRPENGLPASVTQLGANAKRVDYFSQPLIQLQKEYARNLLTHVNPYTGNAYNSEPAVFCVEINNESSLGWDAMGIDLVNIPEPFREELRQLWNAWLAKKYVTTAQLQAQWHGPAQAGPELLRPTVPLTNWNVEKRAAVTASLGEAEGALAIDVKATDGTFNVLQLGQGGLSLEEGQRYTVSFQARGNRPVRVYAGADTGDFHGVGLWQTVAVTGEWKEYRLSFTATKVVPGRSRVVLALGENTGSIAVKDVSLRSGDGATAALAPGSLEGSKIAFPRDMNAAQRRDWVHFIADTELGYARDMRTYLRQELGVKSLVSESQTSFGGLLGIYREAEMDFVDDHGYWDHPQRLGGSWYDQSVNNTPSVPSMSEGSALAQLSRQRVAGKPFSVSEYNHPMPNEYQAECVPLLASFAAFQDWDVVTLHEYGRYGTGESNDMVQDYFAVGGNPAKWAFLPAAALMFRGGQMSPARERATLSLPATVKEVPVGDTTNYYAWLPAAWTLWNRNPAGKGDPLQSRLALELGNPGTAAKPAKSTPVSAAETRLQVRKLDAGQAYYTADSAAAKVVAGAVGGQNIELEGASFRFGKMDFNFGSLSLVGMDGKPLSASRKTVLTLVSRVQNTAPQWSPDRRRLIGWGKAPILAEGVPVDITLKVDGPRQVYALDSTGAHLAPIAAKYAAGTLQFQVSAANRTMWFSVEG